LTTISKTADKLRDPARRKAFVASQINIGIPFQIRALMKQRGWTQKQLAKKTDMLQPRISGLMTAGKTHPNIETLRRIAEAFDCALLVWFAPFSELVRRSDAFDPEEFTVPSFDEEIERGAFIERKSPKSYHTQQTETNVLVMPVSRTPGSYSPNLGGTTKILREISEESNSVDIRVPKEILHA
jgi:transcriptional regulator with XRE-family HTH domain